MFRKWLMRIAVCLFIMATVGCSNAKVSMYHPDQVAAVKVWHVDFTYEAGRYEETVGTESGQESRVVKEGHPPVDLQLRDDIFFRLRDEYGLKTTRRQDQADGLLRLHPLHAGIAGFKSLDVTLLNTADEILARIRINNGDRKATFKENQEFAETSADTIGHVILHPNEPKKWR